MGIRDRNIDWLRQKRVIPYTDFNLIVAGTTNLSGIGAGADVPTTAEVSTFGFGGIVVTANDDFSVLDLQTPSLLDPSKEIGVKVIFTVDEHPTVTTDAVEWIVLYDHVDDNEAMIGAATALDTVIGNGADGGDTGRILRRSSRGIINANTLDYTARQGALLWAVECQALTTFDNDKVTFLGLEIDYIPLVCINPEEDLGALTSDLGKSAGVVA